MPRVFGPQKKSVTSGALPILMMLGIGLASFPSAAQVSGGAGVPDAARRDATKIPEKMEPSGSSTEPLGDRLDRSSGVIHPSRDLDPEIAKPTPNLGPRSTPVIRPPGTTEGSRVDPK
ncbi:MAG: hypothetical protein ACM3JG_07340 [Thiohalocapsa sp.]